MFQSSAKVWLSNPGSQEYGQNMTLINQTFAEDWNIRPNPFSKEQSIQAGPFPRGLKQMTGMWHQMMPDIEVERLQTIRMGNKVAVISEVSATMRDLPQGFDEYPMFPGIPVEKLKGKNFTTLCLAVHVLDDKEHHHDEYEHQHERIRRSWAIEDWTEAADQCCMIGDLPSLTTHGTNVDRTPLLAPMPSTDSMTKSFQAPPRLPKTSLC